MRIVPPRCSVLYSANAGASAADDNSTAAVPSNNSFFIFFRSPGYLSVVLIEEVPNRLHAPLLFLDVRHVAGVLEYDPARAGDVIPERLDAGRRRLVVATRDDQRRHVDPVQLGNDVPVLERADDEELVRPVHDVVDGGIA